jgi:hypothetical protein
MGMQRIFPRQSNFFFKTLIIQLESWTRYNFFSTTARHMSCVPWLPCLACAAPEQDAKTGKDAAGTATFGHRHGLGALGKTNA